MISDDSPAIRAIGFDGGTLTADYNACIWGRYQ
jgi:hypothetical protein